MKRRLVLIFLVVLGSATIASAGFKVKLVESKQPEKFQVHTTVAGVTYAADLLVDPKEQKKYFYRELNPSHIIAIRLAIFNNGKGAIVLPLQALRLIGPDGKELPPVDPAIVAEAVLRGRTVIAGESKNPASVVSPGMRTGDPRLDRTDPRYDPRLDPNDPRYDPTLDPNRPPYDPNDPRSRYPNDPRYGGPWGRPGVDVILSPGGGSRVDLTEHEQALVRKDFDDKAHSTDPVGALEKRDKFLYFSISSPPSGPRGFKLQIAPGKGIPQEIVLEF